MRISVRRIALPTVIAVLLFSAIAFALLPTAYADVVAGNSFGNVAAVQARLSTLGYYTSTVDGKWGSRTNSAVKRFQSDNGLKADGAVGSATASKLKIKLPVTGGISYGKTDFNVAAVQARLKTYGYYTSTVDGMWGNGTLAAVLKYQSNSGLTMDGIVGNGTANKLGVTLSKSNLTGGISRARPRRTLRRCKTR